MNKIKDFFKKTLKKIKEIYFTSYDFVTKNKYNWYFNYNTVYNIKYVSETIYKYFNSLINRIC